MSIAPRVLRKLQRVLGRSGLGPVGAWALLGLLLLAPAGIAPAGIAPAQCDPPKGTSDSSRATAAQSPDAESPDAESSDSKSSDKQSAPTSTEREPVRIECSLENVWRLSPRILSGGQPKSAADFQWLKAQGIQVLVSVDGIRPDLENAAKFQLRYVHIPIGYDSLPIDAQRSLAAVSKLPDQGIYVHCHHGKHRGPTAAAVLCLLDDGRGVSSALSILETAGTSKQYRGLWQSVEKFKLSDATKGSPPELRSVAPVKPIAQAMAKIDRQFLELQDLLDKTKKRGEQIGTDSLRQANSTRIAELRELLAQEFRELPRVTKVHPEAAQQYLDVAELFASLRTNDRSELQSGLARIEQRCATCHKDYRN